MKENSPFTPGSPVPPELFVGRSEQIKEILRYLKQAKTGRQEHVFITGERGMGKTSLAGVFRPLVAEHEFLYVHTFLGGAKTVEEMVRRIFEGVLKESRNQALFDKISSLFGKHVEAIDMFGISLKFKPPQDDLEVLVRNFPDAILNLLEKLKKERKGLFIVLDDINGLCQNPDFANWYKSFADEIAIKQTKFPVLFILIGFPEVREDLTDNQPSLRRIFRYIKIEKLLDSDIEVFYKKMFGDIGIDIEPNALGRMVKYSSGLPFLVHEIGDAVFSVDTDNFIDSNDSGKGIISATRNIGEKYLDEKIYRATRSSKYKSTIRKMGEHAIQQNFTKQEVLSYLDKTEIKSFNNFLNKMREFGVIEIDYEKEKGSYRFVNALYPYYIYLESLAIAFEKLDSSSL
jgi:AAA+ ATPase superfamily predicted ATPase